MMTDYKKKIVKNKRKILFYVIPLIIIITGGSLLFIFISLQPSSDELSSLFGEDYEQMLVDIGDPVSNPTIPTIEHVRTWLYSDKTNEVLYIEDVWMCGDYSVLLLNNAKERNWRMYVVIMFFSYNSDEGYGVVGLYDDSKGHAFNMIFCQDGSDLGDDLDVWYIEPQSDVVWNINYGHYNANNYYYSDIEGTVWNNNIYWINYYNYIG